MFLFVNITVILSLRIALPDEMSPFCLINVLLTFNNFYVF